MTQTKHRDTTSRASSPEEHSPSPHSKPRTSEHEELLDATDALLDEIDEILELNPEPEVPLTLAQLMREGSQLGPKSRGRWKGEEGATCAMSAAYEAAKARGLI